MLLLVRRNNPLILLDELLDLLLLNVLPLNYFMYQTLHTVGIMKILGDDNSSCRILHFFYLHQVAMEMVDDEEEMPPVLKDDFSAHFGDKKYAFSF